MRKIWIYDNMDGMIYGDTVTVRDYLQSRLLLCWPKRYIHFWWLRDSFLEISCCALLGKLGYCHWGMLLRAVPIDFGNRCGGAI